MNDQSIDQYLGTEAQRLHSFQQCMLLLSVLIEGLLAQTRRVLQQPRIRWAGMRWLLLITSTTRMLLQLFVRVFAFVRANYKCGISWQKEMWNHRKQVELFKILDYIINLFHGSLNEAVRSENGCLCLSIVTYYVESYGNYYTTTNHHNCFALVMNAVYIKSSNANSSLGFTTDILNAQTLLKSQYYYNINHKSTTAIIFLNITIINIISIIQLLLNFMPLQIYNIP